MEKQWFILICTRTWKILIMNKVIDIELKAYRFLDYVGENKIFWNERFFIVNAVIEEHKYF